MDQKYIYFVFLFCTFVEKNITFTVQIGTRFIYTFRPYVGYILYENSLQEWINHMQFLLLCMLSSGHFLLL